MLGGVCEPTAASSFQCSSSHQNEIGGSLSAQGRPGTWPLSGTAGSSGSSRAVPKVQEQWGLANKTTVLLTLPRLSQEFSKSHKVKQHQLEVNRVPTLGFKVLLLKLCSVHCWVLNWDFQKCPLPQSPIKGGTAIGVCVWSACDSNLSVPREQHQSEGSGNEPSENPRHLCTHFGGIQWDRGWRILALSQS